MGVLGDILYRAASLWDNLAGNTTTTKKFLTQTGTGAVSAAPGWNSIVAGDLPNTAVTPGSYTATNLTVDAQGRLTAASNGGSGGTVTHTGTLTAGKTIIGNGGVDVTISALTATVIKSSSGTESAATPGTDYVAPGAVTTSGLTQATGKLLGRSTAATGAIEEITVSTGLSLSGGNLTATGSGGTVTTTGSPANGNLTKFTGATSISNADLTGDVTTSGTVATTLANTAVTPGSYTLTNLTVDSKGRITSAANGSTTDAFWTTVTAASDQNIASSTTLTNDAELFFTMTAAKLYTFEIYIIYSSPVGAGTPDLKFAFNGPATLTGIYTIEGYFNTADAVAGGPASGALTAVSPVGTATIPRFIALRGWAYSTAGGSGSSGFIFQWAQNTSNINNVTRLAGSCIRYHQLSV